MIEQQTDKRCVVCGKPADTLWPPFDIGIGQLPYCKECVENKWNNGLSKIERDL